ncbi:MAG: topoisomerase IV, partial [Acutalibacteraceae bacterium]
KDGDSIKDVVEATNAKELLFFTDKCQVYKAKVSDFDDTKASLLGEYIPTRLQMDDGENIVNMTVIDDYSGYMLFFFENGKVAKLEMNVYETKTNRRKLVKAYSGRSPVASINYIKEDCEFTLESSAGRFLILNTGSIAPKTTKDTIGVGVMSLKKGQKLFKVKPYDEGEFKKPQRYRTKNLPALGAFLAPDDIQGEQLSL